MAKQGRVRGAEGAGDIHVGLTRGASFDRTGAYRWRLWRAWDRPGPTVAFVMLNPSRADAEVDDPTIRRCMGFAFDWGASRLEVVNLFGACTSSPAELRAFDEPVGRGNDRALRAALKAAEVVVVAWGVHGTMLGRARALAPRLLRHDPVCLGVTRDGHPRHPLYIPKTQSLEPWPGYL